MRVELRRRLPDPPARALVSFYVVRVQPAFKGEKVPPPQRVESLDRGASLARRHWACGHKREDVSLLEIRKHVVADGPEDRCWCLAIH